MGWDLGMTHAWGVNKATAGGAQVKQPRAIDSAGLDYIPRTPSSMYTTARPAFVTRVDTCTQ